MMTFSQNPEAKKTNRIVVRKRGPDLERVFFLGLLLTLSGLAMAHGRTVKRDISCRVHRYTPPHSPHTPKYTNSSLRHRQIQRKARMEKHQTGQRHKHNTRSSTALSTAAVVQTAQIGVEIESLQYVNSWHHSLQAETILHVYSSCRDSVLQYCCLKSGGRIPPSTHWRYLPDKSRTESKQYGTV